MWRFFVPALLLLVLILVTIILSAIALSAPSSSHTCDRQRRCRRVLDCVEDFIEDNPDVFRGPTGETGPTGAGFTGPAGESIVGPTGATGSGFTGPTGQGPTGATGTGGILAYGYAVGQSDALIGANADVIFDLGATTFPNAGFTSVPAPAGTSFVLSTSGVYEFDFYVAGTPSANFPLEFSIYRNGAQANVGGNGYEFRSQTTASATDVLVCRGEGIILLTAGDVITLHNRTQTVTATVLCTSVPPGGEAGPNRTLTLKRIA